MPRLLLVFVLLQAAVVILLMPLTLVQRVGVRRRVARYHRLARPGSAAGRR